MKPTEYPWGDAADLRIESVDWTHRGEYIQTRSLRSPGDMDIYPEWATEAVFDVNRLVAAPDPASKSGESIRVIGYSRGARAVLGIILLPTAPPEEFDGDWYGVNAWLANSTAQKNYYREGRP